MCCGGRPRLGTYHLLVNETKPSRTDLSHFRHNFLFSIWGSCVKMFSMILLQHFLVLAVGLVLLVLSSDYLVKCSVKLAKLFRLSTFFIGLILVALGTSLPEATVSIIAVLKGQKAIALGNIIGSNIANIGLVFGVCGLLNPLKINPELFKREIPFMMGAAIALIAFSLNGVISRFEGALFVLAFIAFLVLSYKNAGTEEEAEHFELSGFLGKTKSKALVFVLFIISVLVLVFGANLMVNAGVGIADHFGISPWLVAITIFAIGTSLPELAASISASLKKVSSISVGNVIGSNIFNIIFVLGIVALIKPINVEPGIIKFELPALAAFSAIVYFFMRSKYELNKKESILLLFSYVLFILLLIIK